FSRDTAARAELARCGDRLTDWIARRTAARREDRRSRCALRSAGRSALPFDNVPVVHAAAPALGNGAGYRRCDPRSRARGFFLGIRRRCGPRSGTDASGWSPVAHLAEGCAAATFLTCATKSGANATLINQCAN